MKTTTLAIIALLLAGCNTMQVRQEADAQRDIEMAACKERYELRAPRAQCIGEALVRRNQAVGLPDMDLVHLYNAQVLTLAEQVDAGKMPESEYHLQIAKARSTIEAEGMRRDSIRAQAQAQRDQAEAANTMATMSMINAMKPRYPQVRQPVNCYTYSNGWSCW